MTERRDHFIDRVRTALFFAGFDTDSLADQLMQTIERAIRRRFKLSGSEFDLGFADLARDVFEILNHKLAGAIDHDAAADELCEAFLKNNEKEPPPS
jgi:hypothetical protein